MGGLVRPTSVSTPRPETVTTRRRLSDSHDSGRTVVTPFVVEGPCTTHYSLSLCGLPVRYGSPSPES